MFLFKLLAKIFLFPILLTVMLIEWIGVFIVSVIADWIVDKIGCLSGVMKRFVVS